MEEENNVNVTGQIPKIKKTGSPRAQGPKKQIEKRINKKMTIYCMVKIAEGNNGGGQQLLRRRYICIQKSDGK